MPGPMAPTEEGTPSGPDFHLHRPANKSPFDWTPQPLPIPTLFVTPDAGVRKIPDEIGIPMPHHTVQDHGCESVPYQEFISGQALHNLAKGAKYFFRCLLEPTVKHV